MASSLPPSSSSPSSSMSPPSLPPDLDGELDCLLIDNFDSFTWNLYQALSLLGARVSVVRNDALDVAALPLLRINSLIISPGPGHPTTDSGISRDAIRFFTGKVPILGVCMGLECLVDVYGGNIAYAGEIVHGKLSPIRHDARGCFNNIPQGFLSTRYHSLSASLRDLPQYLMVTAATQDSGVIMGVRHREYTLEAVQYHPESVLSQSGDQLLRNFLSLKGGLWRDNPHAHVLDPVLPLFSLDRIEIPAPLLQKVPTILEKIYAQRIKDVEAAKAMPGSTPRDLELLLAMHLDPPIVSLVGRLRAITPALMAEIKRASPSKGNIALTVNAPQQALTYALAGAAVISVLTEPTWFKGSLLDMRLARQAIDSLSNRPAILRKDFILDEYQIQEARLYGADTVLLIVAMLSPDRLRALYMFARSLDMEPLVEVNNASEMQLALEIGAKVIGVNNRNLHDFSVDMTTTTRLVDLVRDQDVIFCALSGISSPDDVRNYTRQGVEAVLVGEALMRASDPATFIHTLLDRPAPPAPADRVSPLIKICGIRSTEEATVATLAGADMLGLVFAPNSKRRLSIDDACDIVAVVRSTPTDRPVLAQSIPEFVNEPWFCAHARRLARKVAATASPLIVGVFQDQPLADILAAVATVPLDMVQLHGAEPAEWARHIPVPVIRAFHVGPHDEGLEQLTRPGLHHHVLLDARRAGEGLSGGSGRTVDWDVARRVVDAGEVLTFSDVPPSPMPVILAGGLDPSNVSEAVQRVHPWAVDVSGGVETNDGHGKDFAKVTAFIRAVREA